LEVVEVLDMALLCSGKKWRIWWWRWNWIWLILWKLVDKVFLVKEIMEEIIQILQDFWQLLWWWWSWCCRTDPGTTKLSAGRKWR
jgi:hypothetical protein